MENQVVSKVSISRPRGSEAGVAFYGTKGQISLQCELNKRSRATPPARCMSLATHCPLVSCSPFHHDQWPKHPAKRGMSPHTVLRSSDLAAGAARRLRGEGTKLVRVGGFP